VLHLRKIFLLTASRLQVAYLLLAGAALAGVLFWAVQVTSGTCGAKLLPLRNQT
jgi:hypothetical protein